MNVYILKLKNNLILNKEGNVARPEPVVDLGLWRKRLNMKTSQVCFSEKGILTTRLVANYNLLITLSFQPKSVKF